jgi:hypothetical protein
MSDLFQDYVRKPFPVQAVLVTPLNIEELAKLCDSKILEGEKEGNFSRQYFKIRVDKPINDRQTEVHVGDYLVRQGRKFKSYQEKQFRSTFDLKNGNAMPKQTTPGPGKKQHNGPNPDQMPQKRTVETSAPNVSEGAVPVTDEQVDAFRKNVLATAQAQKESSNKVLGPDSVEKIDTAFPHSRMEKLMKEHNEVLEGDARAVAETPTEDLHSSPAPVATNLEDLPQTDGRAPERAQMVDPELAAAGLPQSFQEGYVPVYRDDEKAYFSGAVPSERESYMLFRDAVIAGKIYVSPETSEEMNRLDRRFATADALTDMTLDGATAEEINEAVQESIEVMDEIKIVPIDEPTAEEEDLAEEKAVEEEAAEAPKPITLDELNQQAGDTRTAQEIMTEDLPTAGEVFRGEA